MLSTFTASVPRLPTERLLLREYRSEDFDAFAAHLADAESMAHLDIRDRKTAWRIFGSHAGMWLLDGAGWWAMEERETGAVVGSVGTFYRDGSTVLEIGWNTYRASWGKGFASEAAAAALAYALDVRAEPKVHALIAPGNVSSLRVAERIGLRYEGDTDLDGRTIGSFTRYRDGRAAE